MSHPFTTPADMWTVGVRSTLRWQALAGLAAAAAVAWLRGAGLGLAVAYGVALALANGWWLARRIELAGKLELAAGQRVLYVAAAARLLALLAALGLAHVLGLHLLAVAAGLLLAYVVAFAYAAARYDRA